MQQQPTKVNKPFAAFIALVAWSTLIIQFWVNMHSGVASTGELIIRYFSYFTILSNIAVAICCTLLIINPGISFFTKPATVAAVAVYISIVALVYNVILRWQWNPTGLQKVLDNLEHVLVPILFVIYWAISVAKNNLQWKYAFPWAIYPLVYCIVILIRGAASHFYPYPFMNVDQFGYSSVALNCAAVCGTFIIVSLAFIGAGKALSKGRKV